MFRHQKPPCAVLSPWFRSVPAYFLSPSLLPTSVHWVWKLDWTPPNLFLLKGTVTQEKPLLASCWFFYLQLFWEELLDAIKIPHSLILISIFGLYIPKQTSLVLFSDAASSVQNPIQQNVSSGKAFNLQKQWVIFVHLCQHSDMLKAQMPHVVDRFCNWLCFFFLVL